MRRQRFRRPVRGRAKDLFQRGVVLENAEPHEKGAVRSDRKPRKVVRHVERRQNPRLAGAGRAVAGEFHLGAFRERVGETGFHRENLRDDDAAGALFLADRVDGWKNGDAVFRQRSQQQHVVAVEQDVVHRRSVLFPQRAVIERPVDGGAVVDRMKAAQPREMRRVVSLEELTERDRPELLEGFGEIALEIFGEMFSLPVFDGVAAKFDDGEILQVPDRARSRVSLGRHSAYRAEKDADRDREKRPFHGDDFASNDRFAAIANSDRIA